MQVKTSPVNPAENIVTQASTASGNWFMRYIAPDLTWDEYDQQRRDVGFPQTNS